MPGSSRVPLGSARVPAGASLGAFKICFVILAPVSVNCVDSVPFLLVSMTVWMFVFAFGVKVASVLWNRLVLDCSAHVRSVCEHN